MDEELLLVSIQLVLVLFSVLIGLWLGTLLHRAKQVRAGKQLESLLRQVGNAIRDTECMLQPAPLAIEWRYGVTGDWESDHRIELQYLSTRGWRYVAITIRQNITGRSISISIERPPKGSFIFRVDGILLPQPNGPSVAEEKLAVELFEGAEGLLANR